MWPSVRAIQDLKKLKQRGHCGFLTIILIVIVIIITIIIIIICDETIADGKKFKSPS
jgi:hypothetical protein